MQNDEEGFWYPSVDLNRCIDCGLCDRVCPEIKEIDAIQPISNFAAIHRNTEVLFKSSSGGVFAAIAEYVLNKKGVVFGAVFSDKWSVFHDSIETIADLGKIQGSKYVQSDINNSYIRTLNYLKGGRLVLFSGTPCQIAGLKSFLHKDYLNLILVDIICHGVPSPLIWQHYVSDFLPKGIQQIYFRYKKPNWDNYSFAYMSHRGKIISERSYKNKYSRGFLSDLFLRPACYNCSFKSFRSGSDCTIGDFWGIRKILPSLNVDKGCSAVMVNSNRFMKLLKNINISLYDVNYEDILKCNPSLEYSVECRENERERLFARIDSNSFKKVFASFFTFPLILQVKLIVKKIILNLGLIKR